MSGGDEIWAQIKRTTTIKWEFCRIRRFYSSLRHPVTLSSLRAWWTSFTSGLRGALPRHRWKSISQWFRALADHPQGPGRHPGTSTFGPLRFGRKKTPRMTTGDFGISMFVRCHIVENCPNYLKSKIKRRAIDKHSQHNHQTKSPLQTMR